MFKKITLSLLLISFAMVDAIADPCLVPASDPQLCETKEILFSTGEAAVISNKSAELGSAVAIYEYLRNNTEYSVYHGARSSSLNSVFGLRGNDVDLASSLIAMLRSQGIKSRYAVGNIKIPKVELANWLGVLDNDLAIAILGDQGIQNIDATAPDDVIFEHVWVEALVNYENYRAGNTQSSVACVTEGGSCKWVALDVSYKQKTYKGLYKTLLRNVNFDYDAYYNAENPTSPDYVAGMKHKNPLEIYEEQALAYLRTNHPGVTLEDVIDKGEVMQDTSGLLPASLPYEVVSAVLRYDSVEDYDLASATDWSKYLTSQIIIPGCEFFILGSPTVTLAELSTKKLTITLFDTGGGVTLGHRLDGQTVGGTLIAGSFTCNGTPVDVGSPINVELNVDAAPGDDPVQVTYNGLTLGGYYLIASGGETSNWSQVKRAYVDLLAADEQYPIVVDDTDVLGNGIGAAYVDENTNGVADAGDTLLLNNLAAQDALTGGLLYVAQSVYYTRLREESERYSALKGIISPITAYLGIVSTTQEVEYLDNVPFAITPGGLLIDLKGIRLNGSWEVDQTAVYSNETFKFLGHIGSSLEHEVWQEITGYDAISTMRGIQLALADGKNLLDVQNNPAALPPINSYPAAILDLGFANNVPVNYQQRNSSLFGKNLVTWDYTGTATNPGFNAVFPDASSLNATDTRALWLSYGGNNGLDAYVASIDNLENQLIPLQATEGQLVTNAQYNVSGFTGVTVVSATVQSPAGFTVSSYTKTSTDVYQFLISETSNHADGIYPVVINVVYTVGGGVGSTNLPAANINTADPTYTMTCNSTSYTAVASVLLVDLENCFNSTITSSGLTQTIDFLDINQGFNVTTHAYRDYAINIDDYELGFLQDVRNNMYFITTPDARVQYLMPSRYSQGPNYLFNVYIKNTFFSDDLSSSTYAIVNYSNRLVGNGGYVTAEETIIPATSAEFNNEVFTNLNLVSVTNNDVIKTPSTSDPVSTVTGNMYHDETDIVIKGKGLDYAFTRTYNSDQVANVTGAGYPLSAGWTHSYNMSLKSNDYGQHPNYDVSTAPENFNSATSSITYIDERGGESNYLVNDLDSSFAVTPPHLNFDTLELNTPALGQYTITFRNGVKYIFIGGDLKLPGNTARLHIIEDPYGQQLNFAYTGNDLTSISDNLAIAGRTGLTLSYYSTGPDIGRLDTITDWTGRVWNYQYTNGQLTSVTNPLNDAMTYSYHAENGLLNDIIAPQDRAGKQKTMSFGYYENNQAYNYIDQLGNEESLTYDLFRKRTRITNPRGYITEHLYDENGAMVKLVEPDDGIMLFENNTDGLRYSKTDALGNKTTYSYNLARTLAGAASDTFGQVTREQDALGNTLDFSYGIFDQVTDVTNKNNISTQNQYYLTTNGATGAVTGKLQRVVLPTATVNGVLQSNVVVSEYQYNIDGTLKRIEEFIDPAQATKKRITDISYVYDANGFTLTKVTTGATAGGSITTEQRFDTLWRLEAETLYRQTSATNATLLALTTSYEYDNLSRPVKVTDPLGNIAETIYDKNGQVSQIINRYKTGSTGIDTALQTGCTVDAAYPNHHSCVSTTRTYDVNDRLLTEANINGNSISYQYDEMGNVTKVTNRNGHSLLNQYDAMNRLVKVADENGHSVQTKYDLAGRVTSTIDANGNTTKFEYDTLNRLTKTISAENRISSIDQYDGNGNIIKARDANAHSGKQPVNTQGATTYKVYDEFNRVISETNADNETTNYSYDLLGNLTSVTDALNQTTSFIYDDLGRMIVTVDPIIEAPTDKTVTFTYDEAGNRLTMTDRLGETTRTTYDAASRATLVEYLADATNQTAVYDQYGDNVSISNGDVSYSYSYDNRHLMTSKTDSRNGQSISWAYDIAGNVISKTDYQGSVTTFTYDDSNRLVAMANPTYLQASYQYDGAGRLLSRILSNGASTQYNYDKDGFLTKMTQRSADGSIIDDRTYSHDDIGNITSVATATETINYSYDPVYRLLSADSTINTNDQSWSYDNVGNRLTSTLAGNTFYYNYNNTGNRLDDIRIFSNVGPIQNSYDYDDNGSRTAKRDGGGAIIESYTYDQRRLINQATISGSSESYSYDPNAFRIGKTTPTDTNNYLLEGEHLEATYDENNQLKASYLRGVVVDEIINGVEKDSNGKLINRSYHHDQVNSVIATTDHTGATTQSNAYGPFGQSLSTTGTDTNALKYTGRENDNNGLYYYRARYYDPFAGRFLSEDPLGFQAGVNFYAYVGNNPLKFNDPMGLVNWPQAGGALFDMAVSGSGVILSSFGLAAGAAGIAAPEPLTSIAGAGLFTLSLTGLGTSSVGFGLASGDLVSAFVDDPGLNSIPSTNDLITNMLPDSQLTGPLVDIGMFGLDLSTGRAIGNVPSYLDTFSTISDIGSVAGATSSIFDSLGTISGSDASTFLPSSSGSNFNDFGGPFFGSGSSANGGFVLYPNKINSNIINSVYSK